MRKVTRQAAEAFLAGKSGTFGNTTVRPYADDCTAMDLHGNLIAVVRKGRDQMMVSLAGWPTPTTRERLNGLLELFCNDTPAVTTPDGYTYHPRPGFHQRDHTPMLNGAECDPSAWYTVDRQGRLVAA